MTERIHDLARTFRLYHLTRERTGWTSWGPSDYLCRMRHVRRWDEYEVVTIDGRTFEPGSAPWEAFRIACEEYAYEDCLARIAAR